MSIIFFFAFCTFCNLYFWLCTFCALLRQHKILLPVACFHLSWRKFCLFLFPWSDPPDPNPVFICTAADSVKLVWPAFSNLEKGGSCRLLLTSCQERRDKLKIQKASGTMACRKLLHLFSGRTAFKSLLSHFIALVKIDLGQGLNKQTLWHSTFFSFQPNWGFKMDDYNKCFLKNLFLVKMISWTLTGGKSRQIAASLWSF